MLACLRRSLQIGLQTIKKLKRLAVHYVFLIQRASENKRANIYHYFVIGLIYSNLRLKRLLIKKKNKVSLIFSFFVTVILGVAYKLKGYYGFEMQWATRDQFVHKKRIGEVREETNTQDFSEDYKNI